MAAKRTASDILAENRKRLALEADLYPEPMCADINQMAYPSFTQQNWLQHDVSVMQEAYKTNWPQEQHPQYATCQDNTVYHIPDPVIQSHDQVGLHNPSLIPSRVKRMTVSGQTNQEAVTITPAPEYSLDESQHYMTYMNNHQYQWSTGRNVNGDLIYEDISGNAHKNLPGDVQRASDQYDNNTGSFNQQYVPFYTSIQSLPSTSDMTNARTHLDNFGPTQGYNNQQNNVFYNIQQGNATYKQQRNAGYTYPRESFNEQGRFCRNQNLEYGSRLSTDSSLGNQSNDDLNDNSYEQSGEIYEYDDRVYQPDALDIHNNSLLINGQQKLDGSQISTAHDTQPQPPQLPHEQQQQHRETFITIEDNGEQSIDHNKYPAGLYQGQYSDSIPSASYHAQQSNVYTSSDAGNVNVYETNSDLRNRQFSTPVSSTVGKIPVFANNRRVAKRGRPSHKSRQAPVTLPLQKTSNETGCSKNTSDLESSQLLLQRVYGECDIRKPVVSSYIDQLILENELITEMSEAYTPATSLCLLHEDYVRISFSIPAQFPTPKFRQWLSACLPQVDISAIYTDSGADLDSKRPVSRYNSLEDFINDTFYGCRRELKQQVSSQQDAQPQDIISVPPPSMIPVPHIEIDTP